MFFRKAAASRRLRTIAGAALASAGLIAAVAPAAQASHLQGGSFTLSTTADGHLKGTFTYLVRNPCGSGGVGSHMALPLNVFNPGNQQYNFNADGVATVCRDAESVYEAPFDVDLAAAYSSGGAPDGNYSVRWANSARVGGIKNGTTGSGPSTVSTSGAVT